VWLNGLNAALVLILSVAVAVLTEYIYEKIVNRPVTISDGSAVVTGLLLGMNMPPQIPVWIPVIGSVFAILVVKQLFRRTRAELHEPGAGRALLSDAFLRGPHDEL
jgi:electron transport complex protein RnfD